MRKQISKQVMGEYSLPTEAYCYGEDKGERGRGETMAVVMKVVEQRKERRKTQGQNHNNNSKTEN